jgi:hypothetical protein
MMGALVGNCTGFLAGIVWMTLLRHPTLLRKRP